jgi:hypothetical protein
LDQPCLCLSCKFWSVPPSVSTPSSTMVSCLDSSIRTQSWSSNMQRHEVVSIAAPERYHGERRPVAVNAIKGSDTSSTHAFPCYSDKDGQRWLDSIYGCLGVIKARIVGLCVCTWQTMIGRLFTRGQRLNSTPWATFTAALRFESHLVFAPASGMMSTGPLRRACRSHAGDRRL